MAARKLGVGVRPPKKRVGRTITGDELRRMFSGESMRFPAAGPRPQSAAALNEWMTRDLIFRAVHTNDPTARERLARRVADALMAGKLPSLPERQWLAWMIARLVAADTVPHLARGSASKDQLDVTIELVRFMARSEKTGVVKRLKDAAEKLNISEPTARALYYSPVGKALALAGHSDN